MKGSIDGIKCMFIDLLTVREWWGEGGGRKGRERKKEREETTNTSQLYYKVRE